MSKLMIALSKEVLDNIKHQCQLFFFKWQFLPNLSVFVTFNKEFTLDSVKTEINRYIRVEACGSQGGPAPSSPGPRSPPGCSSTPPVSPDSCPVHNRSLLAACTQQTNHSNYINIFWYIYSIRSTNNEKYKELHDKWTYNFTILRTSKFCKMRA